MLAASWAHRILEAVSIDIVYAPSFLAAQIYNVHNTHWVLCFLLVSSKHTFLCLVFDPLWNSAYMVGANREVGQSHPRCPTRRHGATAAKEVR